jgi:hypothetical protein
VIMVFRCTIQKVLCLSPPVQGLELMSTYGCTMGNHYEAAPRTRLRSCVGDGGSAGGRRGRRAGRRRGERALPWPGSDAVIGAHPCSVYAEAREWGIGGRAAGMEVIEYSVLSTGDLLTERVTDQAQHTQLVRSSACPGRSEMVVTDGAVRGQSVASAVAAYEAATKAAEAVELDESDTAMPPRPHLFLYR